MAKKEALAQEVRRRYQRMLLWRQGMRQIWNMIMKFVLLRDPSWGDTSYKTPSVRISVKGVHDDTAVDVSEAAAAGFVGALWPNSEESFEVVPHPLMHVSPEMKAIVRRKDVKAYYKHVTHRARQPFASADCGWSVSFGEHMREQVNLGTSGIVGEEDDYDNFNPCFFRSASVETALISEGRRGLIDSVAFEYQWTVNQVVGEFGLKNCSERVQTLAKTIEQREENVRLVHIIYPRNEGKEGAPKKDRPFASVWMELDGDHVLREGGQDRLTAWMSRFTKRPNELYGRSLALQAMLMIKQANVIRASMNKALSLHYEPPLGIRTSQFGGQDTVDLGPNGRTPMYDTKGLVESNRPPVEKLLEVPEPTVGNQRMTEIEQRMMQKFLLDKLFDFNNKTRMTLGEAKLRSDFRNQALGSYFERQMTEVLHPAIMWVLHVHWRRKLLGLHPDKDAVLIQKLKDSGAMPLVMPKVVADFWDATGKLPFAIRFVSPAARAMAADSANGVEQLTNYVLALVKGGVPDAADNMDWDESIEIMAHKYGAPPDVIRGSDERDTARKHRQDMQMQMATLQAQEQQSGIAKNNAKAAKDAAQAGLGPGGLSNGAA